MVHKTFFVLLFLLFTSPALAFHVDVEQVCFSPDGDCTAVIVEKIDKAKTEVLLKAYSFKSAPIAKALVRAHKRGLAVEATLDKSNETAKYSAATFLFNQNIPVLIDSAYPIAHNDFLINDQKVVVTGSFNFSKGATKKAENILIVNSSELAKTYLDKSIKHKEHSEVYQRRI